MAQPSRTALIIMCATSAALSMAVGGAIALRGVSDPAPTRAVAHPEALPQTRPEAVCTPRAAFTAEENRVRLFLGAARAANEDPRAFRLKLPSREGAVPLFTYTPRPGGLGTSVSVDGLDIGQLQSLGSTITLGGTVRPECLDAAPTSSWDQGPTGDGQGPAVFDFTVTTTTGQVARGTAAVNGSVITQLTYH